MTARARWPGVSDTLLGREHQVGDAVASALSALVEFASAIRLVEVRHVSEYGFRGLAQSLVLREHLQAKQRLLGARSEVVGADSYLVCVFGWRLLVDAEPQVHQTSPVVDQAPA